MPKTIDSIDDLQEYLLGMMARADHHGKHVRDAALYLAGLIVLYKDPETKLKVKVYDGRTANILWAIISGRTYAFAYNHDTSEIEIRDRTERGKPLYSIINKLTCSKLRTIMDAIKARQEEE